jgi:hypothetical protein
MAIDEVGSVTDEAAIRHVIAGRIDRRHRMTRRESSDLIGSAIGSEGQNHEHGAGSG